MRHKDGFFERKKARVMSLLAYGPMRGGEIVIDIGSEVQAALNSLIAEGLVCKREIKYGRNDALTGVSYYRVDVPEEATSCPLGFSDKLRVFMGMPPMKKIDKSKARVISSHQYYLRWGRRISECTPNKRVESGIRSSMPSLEAFLEA